MLTIHYYNKFMEAWWSYIVTNNLRTVADFAEWCKAADFEALEDRNRALTYDIFAEDGLVDCEKLQMCFDSLWLGIEKAKKN